MANYHQTGFETLQALANEKLKEQNRAPCGCGRSVSGFCDGSHGLTEEQWKAKLDQMVRKEKELKDEFDDDV